MSTLQMIAAPVDGAQPPLQWRPLLQELGLLPRHSEHPAHEALLPLLEFLGWRGDARALVDLLQIHPTRFQWGDLANILHALGYQWLERRGPMKHVREGDLPCLFIPDSAAAQPMLLQEVAGAEFLAHVLGDAQTQTIRPGMAVGRIVRIRAMEEADVPPRSGQWFKALIHQFRGQFCDALLLGLLIQLFALSVPIFTMLVYDRVIAGHNLSTLMYLLAGVTIALLAEALFRRLRAFSLSWFGVRVNHIIAITMFQRLFSLDPLSIERAPPAAQMVRAKAMEAVRDFLTGQSFILFIEFPFFPVLLAALVCFSPTMAAACFGAGVLLAALLATQLRSIRRLSQRSARAMSERQRDALELFSKLETLRSHGLSDVMFARFQRSNTKANTASMEVNWRMQMVEHLVLALSMVGGLFALLLGVQHVWDGSLSPGGLIAAMIVVWRILMPLQQLAAIAPRLEQVNGGIAQLEQLLAMPPERSGIHAVVAAQPIRGQVELVNLAMRYPRQTDTVFSGLSLQVQPGEMVAIAGANGSGKSSVLKLINGMYRQAAGSVRLDGIDIRQLDPLALRRGISYVAQSPIVFSGTVLENLTLATPLATQEQLMAALEAAGVVDDVMQLPEGLHTILGEAGMRLPQAMAYKLGLARAYLNLAPLVLCDELPYALLSAGAGTQFRQHIASLKGRHTIVLVAHTSDLVTLADKAVFLQANRRPIVGKPADIIPLMLEQTHASFA